MSHPASPSPPAYQIVADSLRARIVSGDLKPHDQLPIEPDLCAEFGVSRTTVREALRLLASQHLVVTKRGVLGGTFVAEPSPDQITSYLQTSLSLITRASGESSIIDLLEVRDQLEVPAAGLAAERRTDDDLIHLESQFFNPEGRDLEAIFESNRGFHLGLLRAAGNPLLEAVTTPLFSVLHERLLRGRAPRSFWRSVDADHREIHQYVTDGDAAGAREAQHAHLKRLRTTYTRIDRRNSSS